MHPMSSLDWNLSKKQGDMSKLQTKKVVFFMILIPKFILKICLRGAPFLNFKHFDWIIHDDMEFVLFLEGLF